MYQKFNEVESIFHEEVSAKKKEFNELRTATKHKRLGKKSVMFPSDYMTRKEKLKHRKAGEVMTTNMYDTILTIAEFEALETFEKKNRLQYWRNEKTNKEILKGMGINSKRYYELVAELDLPKAPRTNRKGTTTTKKKETKPVVAVKESVPEVQPEQPQFQEIIVNGMNLAFIGTYKAEQIQKQLKKFCTLLEDESEDFYLEFRLMQKQPTKKK